ncbi:MAG: proline dehydrogenase family protein [Acidobacteriaceae bacterium]
MGRRMSSRFVAGMQVDEVLHVAETLNQQGMAVTLDSLGENVSTADEARRSADIYHRLIDEIRTRKLNANVSVKLTQMGLELSEKLAHEIAADLVQHAVEADTFVRIDMEGSEFTQGTVDMVREIHARPGFAGHVGVVIQAYLFRSEADIAQLVRDGVRIRLCKGAYKEPATIAFPDKRDVDANYVKLMQALLTSGLFHGIATHDEEMIAATKRFAAERGIGRDRFEFQMLYGIRRDLQAQLVAEGYGMRVYVPFGAEWYPYFMRRLAERPANVIFLAKNMLRS